ncbi:hypothetical protein OOK36_55315 [Streptomyces sp. NBC_00365]|uniref:hypothetical protein n=1 Tax=Streptomyces sp. NBC_00365 TaxID=2975726 RepID=UPI00224FF1D7|nr:hypothetical protein [Streptomyces sp. NBC_00365]MCX5097625.1 hypothetical protein [Streptomyces sp. NBC_00365]
MRVYRGQKEWDPGMEITAPSLRHDFGHDAVVMTDQLLLLTSGLVSRADSGDEQARSALENRLLHMQNSRYENPYVSCSHHRFIAQSFALALDTPGFVLTIEGGQDDGLDYERVRQRHGMFGDAVGHLSEFGIPKAVRGGFVVTRVEYIKVTTHPGEVVYECA